MGTGHPWTGQPTGSQLPDRLLPPKASFPSQPPMRAAEAWPPWTRALVFLAAGAAMLLLLLLVAAPADSRRDTVVAVSGAARDGFVPVVAVAEESTEVPVTNAFDAAHEMPGNDTALLDQDDVPVIASDLSTREELVDGLRRCHEANFTLAERTPGTLENRIKRADCGMGYDFRHSAARTAPWLVVLYGPGWSGQTLEFSGCPIGVHKCPWSPHCTIHASHEPRSAEHADVVVVFQKYAEFATKAHRRSHNGTEVKPVRVLYWREALWPAPGSQMQRQVFDFEMGVHHYSGILNPDFLRGPSTMMRGFLDREGQPIEFLPPAARTGFAISVISDCNTPSFRRLYLTELLISLGHDKVHQYGRCGTLQLPGKPIERAVKVISTYKFYFAFENTIMSGYVTEKLTSVLMMNIVPVYYGTLDAPNITKTPSYIRASDFKSPAALAEYLLYLDAHPDEYMKYHAWRKDPTLFDDEYLNTIENRVPGPVELQAHAKYKHYPRTTACCRLCDANFVKRAKEERSPLSIVGGAKMSYSHINRVFFDGKLKG